MTLHYDFLSIRITLSGKIDIVLRQHTFNMDDFWQPAWFFGLV